MANPFDAFDTQSTGDVIVNPFDAFDTVDLPANVATPLDTPTAPSDRVTPSLADVMTRAIPAAAPTAIPSDPSIVSAFESVPQTDPMLVAKDSRSEAFRAEALALESEIPNLPDDETRAMVSEEIALLRTKADQIDVMVGEPAPELPSLGEIMVDHGRRFARGAAAPIAAVPAASEIRAARSERGIAKDATGFVQEAQQTLQDIAARRAEFPNMTAEDAERLATVEAEALATIESYTPIQQGSELAEAIPDANTRSGFELADTIRQAVTDATGAPDPARDEKFMAQFAEGLGNMTSMAATAVPTLGAGGAFTGSAMNAEQVYTEAKQIGADEKTALESAKYAGIVGMAEVLPIMAALKPLEKTMPGIKGRFINVLVKKLGLNATEEAVQEGAAQVANNLIAAGHYDPDRGWDEGVTESMILGAALGGTLGGVGALRPDGKPAITKPPTPSEEPTQEDIPHDGTDGGEPLLDSASERGGVLGDTVSEQLDNGAGEPRDEPVPESPIADSDTGPSARADVDENRSDTGSTSQRVDDLDGAQPAQAEQTPVESTPVAAPETPQKKPLTSRIKSDLGSVNPDSDLGKELKGMGFTSKTSPGLFSNNGRSDFDNIPATEHPEIAEVVGTDDNGYLDQRRLIDLLDAEARSTPTPIGTQAEVQATYAAYLDGLDAARRSEPLPELSAAPVGVVSPESDIRQPQERRDDIAVSLQQVEEDTGYTLTDAERSSIIEDLDQNGGSVEAAMINLSERELRGETRSDQPGRAQGEAAVRQPANPERSGSQPGIESDSAAGSVDAGRARQGTKNEGSIDVTPEGDQTVIPGAEKITDKEQAERKQDQPLRGGDAPAGGLFDDDARNQTDMFDKPRTKDGDSGSVDDAPARTGRRPKGSLSPTFSEYSYTNRRSVFKHAFQAAGVDPDKASLMPVDRQTKLVRKAIEDKYGVKIDLPTTTITKRNLARRMVNEERSSLNHRKALDQLLNAYRQIGMMAHVMGLPEKAMGLPIDGKPITLSLVSGSRLKGALGRFSWGSGGRVIHIPDMSNSFAHEWAHALDHYLGASIDRKDIKGMISRKMHFDGIIPPLSPKRALTEAYAHILWSMYGKNMGSGEIILGLQVEGVQMGKDGKPTPKAKRAQKILNDIRAGKPPPKAYWSDYFKTSAEFDKQTGSDGYFSDPAEMFARAFESMIGTEVAKISDQPQALLSKGEWAYSDTTDPRAALTFPKGIDLAQFTLAMGNLQHAMARVNLFGKDAPAQIPENHDVLSTRQLLKAPKESPGVALKQGEARAWAQTIEDMGNLPDAAKRTGKSVTSGVSAFYSQAIRTGAATMYATADTQPNQKAREAFTNIAKLVGKRPGNGKLITSVWEETVRRKAAVNVNKIDGALKKSLNLFGRANPFASRKHQEELRTLLTDGEVENVNPAIEKLAVDLRAILDDIWYDLDNAGIKMGYSSNYLPHIYDAQKASENPAEFRKQAKKVYEILFEQEIRSNKDVDGQLADMQAIKKGLMAATSATAGGDRTPTPRLSESDVGKIDAYFADARALAAEQKALAKLTDPKAKAKREGKISDLEKGLESKKVTALDIMGSAWAEYSADNWMIRMRTGNLDDFGSIGPTANFLKGRVLPNEAGSIMRKFMHDNPIEMITNYAMAAAKRAEYARVFGADNEKLKNMLDAAEGATHEDIEMMKMGVQAATGRLGNPGSGWQSFSTTVYSIGTIALLPISAFSSLAEPITAGIRSGQARDGLHAMASSMINLVRGGRRRELQEIARTIGLVMPYAQDTLMQNRMGADVLNGPHWLQKNLSKFFIINGLTPLTHWQRASMLPVANAVLLRNLRADVEGKRGIYGTIRDQIDGERGGHADGELNELGVAKDERADLLAWLDDVGGMPSPEDMFGPDGNFHKSAELWARATNRFTTETIQDTLKSDRAMSANDPSRAAIYGIMSFIDAFTRNVIFRSLERGMKDGDSANKKLAKAYANTALATLPFGSLVMGQILYGVLREALFNPDELEKKMDDGELAEWLIARGTSRSGLLGRADPVLNLLTGVRYDTDMTSAYAGPFASYFLNNTQKILAAEIGRNSPKNNTAEFNASKAAYRMFVKPAALTLMSRYAPGGPISVSGARLGMGFLSRRSTEGDFAEALVGEKGSKHVGDPPWWERGGE